jgi:propanol-preferring alcohol dehydrogenase
MKAAQIVAFGQPLELRDVAEPSAGRGDAVVRVEAEGICRSDWHAWMGDGSWIGLKPTLPITPGHELAGEVVEVGHDVEQVAVGDRVTVPFHEGCGRCSQCQTAKPNRCEKLQIIGFSHDGGYAQFVRILEADFNCVKLPETVDAVTAAAIGCRYMTAYHAVTTQGCVRPGYWVAVYGAGGVGLSAVQVASAVGANPIAVDIDESKLERAKQEGAAVVVNAQATDAPRLIKEVTGGGAHVSLDALGIETTVTNSVKSLRRGGRHVQVGLTTKEEGGKVALPIDIMTSWELEFVGSLGNPHPNYAGLLALVESGKLRPQSLIGQHLSLESAGEVLASMTDFKTTGINVITEF